VKEPRLYLTACRDWQLPVLLESMRRHCRPFHLCVIAWDFEPAPAADVSVMTRATFLARHPGYEYLPGPPRATINVLDCVRWRAAADLLQAGEESVTYIDGDQWFFSSPEAVFEEIGDAKLAVTPHGIPPRSAGLPGVVLETHRQYGLYNSGFFYVADVGIAEEMASACFAWCYSDAIPQTDGTWLFGDQGFLEQTAKRHDAHVILHPGVNVAPWNANCHRIEERGGQLLVDGRPLVTYHFSGLRRGGRRVGDEYCVPRAYLEQVYEPYVAAIEAGRQKPAIVAAPNWVPPHRIVIAAQYWAGDEARMMRLVRLLADIEPRHRDDIVLALARSFDCPQSDLAIETMMHASEKFLTILLQSERRGAGYPDGANALWAGTMDVLADVDRRGDLRAHSVFLIEADGCPLSSDWVNVLAAAHRRTMESGKRITGPEMTRIPHVNGSMIAHLSLWSDRLSLHSTPPGQGWDLFHAAVLLAEARTTREILNVHGAGDWSDASLSALGLETAWLCSQKDDSPLAWAERTLTVAAREQLSRDARGGVISSSDRCPRPATLS